MIARNSRNTNYLVPAIRVIPTFRQKESQRRVFHDDELGEAQTIADLVEGGISTTDSILYKEIRGGQSTAKEYELWLAPPAA